MNKTKDTKEKIAEFLSSDWPGGWADMPGKIKEVFYDEAEGVLKLCKEAGLVWNIEDNDGFWREEKIDV